MTLVVTVREMNFIHPPLDFRMVNHLVKNKCPAEVFTEPLVQIFYSSRSDPSLNDLRRCPRETQTKDVLAGISHLMVCEESTGSSGRLWWMSVPPTESTMAWKLMKSAVTAPLADASAFYASGHNMKIGLRTSLEPESAILVKWVAKY